MVSLVVGLMNNPVVLSKNHQWPVGGSGVQVEHKQILGFA